MAGRPELEWPGLDWLGLAGRLIFRSELNSSEIGGLTEGELPVGPGGVWRNREPGARAQALRKPRVEGSEALA